ncbi:MAG: hypothetical protein H6707_14210 [Deltaproteobacteria bacterium]|nr:hypothetical protein [Deltaproteobacteria bacterium]
MRERVLTPFFSLSAIESAEHETDELSAREFEGKIVGGGRFLLLRKLSHTSDAARFLAKDMHGGLDVELELRCADNGYQLGNPDACPKNPSVEVDVFSLRCDLTPAPEKVVPQGRSWRRWLIGKG